MLGLDRARFSGQVNVGTGSTVVRGANGSRLRLILTNDSANVQYVQLSTDGNPPTAVANQGVRLNANGGSLVLDDYQGPVAALNLVAAGNLCVLEL